jgi:hypothetical protein
MRIRGNLRDQICKKIVTDSAKIGKPEYFPALDHIALSNGWGFFTDD